MDEKTPAAFKGQPFHAGFESQPPHPSQECWGLWSLALLHPILFLYWIGLQTQQHKYLNKKANKHKSNSIFGKR